MPGAVALLKFESRDTRHIRIRRERTVEQGSDVHSKITIHPLFIPLTSLRGGRLRHDADAFGISSEAMLL
jgi:hypothetical protein